IKEQTFIDPNTSTIVDVVDELDVDGWAFGGAFGMMIRPNNWLRIGMNYRTQVKDTLQGDGTFQTLGGFDAELTQVLPTLITTGFSARVNSFLLFSFAYGWERNSELKNINIDTDLLGAVSLPQNWKNSHTFHFGIETTPLEHIHILAGYAKDFNESIPDAVNNRVTGDVAAQEISAGVGIDLGKAITTTLSWNGRFGDRTVPVTATNLAPGEISAFIHTLSFGLGVNL
ncbi:MAG: outer membrane protein transport protein, partial [Bdellovibrionales bacterium]|nr:outer membrane protein transport protein [Bdellovibrionales bacterium]